MNHPIHTNRLSKQYGKGTLADIIDQTDTTTVEEAFITAAGGTEQKELLVWRK
jgi:hypothetical protein